MPEFVESVFSNTDRDSESPIRETFVNEVPSQPPDCSDKEESDEKYTKDQSEAVRRYTLLFGEVFSIIILIFSIEF